MVDEHSETGLALAKFHLGKIADVQPEAKRLSQLCDPSHRLLAQLWLAIGDPTKAKHHALAAYKWAWADGEPFVRRYELTKSAELLGQLRVPIPELLPYDPTKDELFPWEEEVSAAIAKLRGKKDAEKKPDALK